MQIPGEKTPISKDLDLAAYAGRMLGKFTAKPVLADLAVRMLAAGGALGEAQRAYEVAARAILPARVDVKYENFVSDQCIRRIQKRAELADDRTNGPIATALFPDGSSPIVRLLGASQVQAMLDFEGKLDGAKELWVDALAAKGEVAQFRVAYQGALEGRRAAGQASRDLRAARNIQRTSFLKIYAEIASRVKAEFPRDKAMQDLFFDDVRTRSTAEMANSDEEVDDGDADDGEGAPPAATPA